MALRRLQPLANVMHFKPPVPDAVGHVFSRAYHDRSSLYLSFCVHYTVVLYLLLIGMFCSHRNLAQGCTWVGNLAGRRWLHGIKYRHNATYITQVLVIRIDFQAEAVQFALEPIPAAFDSRNAEEWRMPVENALRNSTEN